MSRLAMSLLICIASMGGVMVLAQENIILPKVVPDSEKPLLQLLKQRRSVRDYHNAPLSLEEVGQLLWAAQGITHQEGLRSAPSAGALYPLEIFVVAGQIEGMAPGIYRYMPTEHQLLAHAEGDRREKLAQAAYKQNWLSDAAIIVVFAAVYERTTRKYGKRGIRYVHIEAGHASENLFLMAESLELGSVIVGAFDDDEIKTVLRLAGDSQPLILMPVGRKAIG
jgi:SagB-type dehydrogenase family enzyme